MYDEVGHSLFKKIAWIEVHVIKLNTRAYLLVWAVLSVTSAVVMLVSVYFLLRYVWCDVSLVLHTDIGNYTQSQT